MHDNKVRLSRDVLEKAEIIAAEWGLKNARAAIEAVFRRYCDDYLYGREPSATAPKVGSPGGLRASQGGTNPQVPTALGKPHCEALDALDELLAL